MTDQLKQLSRKKRFLFSLVLLFIPAAASLAVYAAYVGQRSGPLYRYIKENQRSWRGGVHQADPELGHAPVPGSRGAEVFPVGHEIPARYDQDGFRVPLLGGKARPSGHRPVILALGCSFTYGAATAAEHTYPHLVGQYLDALVKNAGVASYGLSQMLVLAGRLIPVHKPDYLLVQYSPWLVQRAQTPFAPTYFGWLPTPYFVGGQEGLKLHPPVFQTRTMDLPIDGYRTTPRTFLDKISFVWNVGLPLFAHDDLQLSRYRLRKALGKVPEPAADPQEINRHVYAEIGRLAREHGAQLVIVILGEDHNPVRPVDGLFPPEAIVINAQDELLRRLPAADPDAYAQSYFHWRGAPPRMVDNHPNEAAHRVTAEAIARRIRASLNRP